VLHRVSSLIVMAALLPACSTVGVDSYSTFAMRFGFDHPKQANADGWYSIPVRLEWNDDLQRPFVARARTERAPVYHQLVHLRGNTPGLPELYCDYVFTFDEKDRLRSVAEKEESCSRNPI
jgi:hypothetical protein